MQPRKNIGTLIGCLLWITVAPLFADTWPVFEDNLINTSKISGQYGSGTFSSAGYTLNYSGYTSPAGEPQSRDFVYYNLDGVGMDGTGSIEVDVKGLYSSDGLEKNHILTIADRSGCCDTGVNPCNPVTNGWAIYGSRYFAYFRKINYPDAPSYTNKMKLTAGVPGDADDPCKGVELFTGTAYTWNGTTVYRFRMTWTNNRVRFYRGLPGQTLDTLLADYTMYGPWAPVKLHIQVGASSIAQIVTDIGGTPGTVYSLIRVYEEDLGNTATPPGGPAVAPVIAEVTPDPDPAIVGVEYIKQLSLVQGTAPIAWSVVSGPSGLKVDSTGRVYGWTPTSGQFGTAQNITIRASNSLGSDTENWLAFVTNKADFDADSDVDLADFGFLQVCYSGSGVVYPIGCARADLDGDNDVDQNDFTQFKACLGGANRSPGC